MPVLSLPLPRIATGVGEYLPIRIPFPFWRIASILPQAVNEPIKTSLLALFKLAWSAKLQIPVLITIVFMAFDIRLQLEINIFWETNNRHANQLRGGTHNRNGGGQSDMDTRRAALLAAAIYQQQRRRLIREMRVNQMRVRQLRNRANQLQQRESPQFPPSAPLALEEDSDLDDSHQDHLNEEEESDEDTITCSQRSTTSEAGSFGSDDDESDFTDEDEADEPARKKKKKKRSRPSSAELDDDDDDDDDSTTTDDDEDDDDDDDDIGGNGGINGGSSRGGNGGYRDDDSDDPDYDDEADDGSPNDPGGGGYGSPLVVEVEIRHRPLFRQTEVNDNLKSCQKISLIKVSCNPFHFLSLRRNSHVSSFIRFFCMGRADADFDYYDYESRRCNRNYINELVSLLLPNRFTQMIL